MCTASAVFACSRVRTAPWLSRGAKTPLITAPHLRPTHREPSTAPVDVASIDPATGASGVSAARMLVHDPRAQWLHFNCVTHLLPAVAVSAPLLIYPHIFALFFSAAGYIILCFLFLCVCAVATPPHDTAVDCSAEPRLEVESSSEQSERRGGLDEMSSHAGQLKVVTLDHLEKKLASQSAASVMTALYTTDELLTSVNSADASFAIIRSLTGRFGARVS